MEVCALPAGMEKYGDTPIYYDGPEAALVITDKDDNTYPGDSLPDSNHIRLIELWEPAPKAFTLRFRTERLDTAPDFHALSYTWGTTFRDIPSLGLRITGNLFSALSNLAEETPRLWWIDALCINQQDVEEKNQQVRLMRQIYGKAKQVCIWLGEPDTASLDLLRKIADRVSLEELLNFNAVFDIGMLERYGLPHMKDPAWSSLMQFVARPYFRRVWVVQELVIGNKTETTVACGRLRFDWLLISAPIHWIRTTNLHTLVIAQASNPMQLSPTMDDVITLDGILENRDLPVTLEYLISLSMELESTDPRDKIIALLGLVSPRDPSVAKIKIDYRLPVTDFFHDVTGTIITTNKSLKLLAMRRDESTRTIPELPSWVPDYAPASTTKYRMIQFAVSDDQVDAEWIPGSNILTFNAHFVDVIESVSDHVPQRGCRPTATLFVWFDTVAETFAISPWELILSFEYPVSETAKRISEEFWRCLIGDAVARYHPAPPEYGGLCAAALFSNFYQQQLKSEDWDGWLFDLSKEVLACLKERDILGSMENDPQVRFFTQLVEIIERKRPEPKAPAHWKLPETWVRVEGGTLMLGPPGDLNEFTIHMAGKSFQTRLFFTKTHPKTNTIRMGRGPISTRPGDRVAVTKGTNQVLILREAGEHYRLVGECYLGGLMGDRAPEDDSIWERISLI